MLLLPAAMPLSSMPSSPRTSKARDLRQPMLHSQRLSLLPGQ